MTFIPSSIIVTGGAGFIGSNFIHSFISGNPACRIVNLDALTYAGNLKNLSSLVGNPLYRFVKGDIGDAALVAGILAGEKIDAVVLPAHGATPEQQAFLDAIKGVDLV